MNSTVTNKGNALLAKGLTGIPIEFSKIALGDGNLGAIDPKELSNIISPRVESTVSNINLEGAGIASVSATFSNEDLEEGFYYRECGLFAIDPDEGEILYSYGNAGDQAGYIAPTGTSTLIEKVIKLELKMGDAVNVIVELSSDVVASKEYVDNQVASKVSKSEGTSTITTTGWVANTGDYAYKLDLAVIGILSTDSVDVFVDNNDQNTAQDASLSPNNESYNGGITFYAKSIPTATIGFSYRGLR